ncbi:MAG: hypothetical protein QM535_20265 [Limnohabitans sp.]|nr:hypothetical protein [Limnohabitans sp.]
MKIITFILFSFLLLNCKSNSKLIGKYQANLTDSTNYTFNLSNKKYTHKFHSGTVGKGKFKIIVLSSEKTLLVCNELVFKKGGGLIKETNSEGDSITVGTFNGYKNFGNTVFEITSKKDSLLFRKTYANKLQKTESEGILISLV